MYLIDFYLHSGKFSRGISGNKKSNLKPGIYFCLEDRALQKRVYLAMIKIFKEAAENKLV